jgi:hypothetical protein
MCVRTHGLRSNANAVARKAKVERNPVSPRLMRSALAVIYGRPCGARSTIDNRCVRTQAREMSAHLAL